jgi:GNAT superfamily N-acetyltransferase
MLKFHRLNGHDARQFTRELAELRLKVFWDFPYLYAGSVAYEESYLETYFKAKYSLVFLVEDEGKIVGATTGIWAKEEEKSFRQPFLDYGIDPDHIFYFGESVLLPEYRGQGLGKFFFEEREKFARSLGFIQCLAFCAVDRSPQHHLRPKDYSPLDPFWMGMGFKKIPGLKTHYDWPDRGEDLSTSKEMQFWMKQINQEKI